MKITWKNKDGNVQAEFEADNVQDILFKVYELEKLNEVEDFTDQGLFEACNQLNTNDVLARNVCGKCKSQNIKMRVREVDDNKFYEKVCKDCHARLSYGVNKGKGKTLFVRSKDEAGNYLPDYGWKKWNPETKREE